MSKTNTKVASALRELATALACLGEEPCYEVLSTLLTAPEREKIALRWRLVCLLEQGVTQRAIALELGISLCKITRGSHELKYGPESFRNVVQKAVSKGVPRATHKRTAKR
jgi:TrpR family transcriptional regulator, trp operon repressor